MHRTMLVALSLSAGIALAQSPQMTSVSPDHGKVGTVLKATGLALGSNKVEAVYLSDNNIDLMVKVLDQKDGSIEFRIPPSVKPGRLRLMLKATDNRLLDQPIFVTVEDTAPAQGIVAAAR